MSMKNPPANNHGAEPFAFALLQWPAMFGLLSLGDSGWPWVARLALGAWLVLSVVAGYSGRRGVGFGNTMLLLLACVVGAWWCRSSAWAVLWLAPLLIGLLAAQQALAGGGRAKAADSDVA
ncbi:hypothetical protein [Variovorax saccharolyticus]|uniref:hypothetical protein n=1 Tax=Variovorax saccharolyticus TaxID=3053516 RepID=UPI0025785DDF|nr:hypothetical protein [Variovorax sp. J31P216]MDM0030035.1 hypothetical protein [Variovorax sp. J31P216]